MQETQQDAWQGLTPVAATTAQRFSYYAETPSEVFGVAAEEPDTTPAWAQHGPSLHGEATLQPNPTVSSSESGPQMGQPPLPQQPTAAAAAAAAQPGQVAFGSGRSSSSTINSNSTSGQRDAKPSQAGNTQPWQQQLVQQQARLQQLRPLPSSLPPPEQPLQPQQQQLGADQTGHALLAVLNPLESVLWQQRQHSRALLDRALHVLTSLQSDVDKLLVASKEVKGQHKPPLLLQSQQHAAAAGLGAQPQPQPQPQQPQQQAAGSSWSIAAGWTAAGSADGHKPDSSSGKGVVAPAHHPTQQKPMQALQAQSSAGQQQQQQDADALDPADFEAELLQAEAAAPGRRLSEETLKQYTALVWHSSIDDTESTTDAAAESTAAPAAVTAGAPTSAAASDGSSGSAGSGGSGSRPAGKQQLSASGEAEPGGPAAAQQQQQQQQQAKGTFNSAASFEQQLLALEAAAPGRRQMSAATLLDAAGAWDDTEGAAAVAGSSSSGGSRGGSSNAGQQSAGASSGAAAAARPASCGSSSSSQSGRKGQQTAAGSGEHAGSPGSSSGSGCSKELNRHVTFKLPREGSELQVSQVTPDSSGAVLHATVEQQAAVPGDAANAVCSSASSRGTASGTGGGSGLRAAAGSEAGAGAAGAAQAAVATASVSAAAAAAGNSSDASPGRTRGGSGAERLQLQLDRPDSFGGLRACDSSGSIGCLGSFHGTPAAEVAAANACRAVPAATAVAAAAATSGDGSSVAGSCEDLGICGSSDGDDFEAMLRAQEVSARAAAGAGADSKQEDRWWSNDGAAAAANHCGSGSRSPRSSSSMRSKTQLQCPATTAALVVPELPAVSVGIAGDGHAQRPALATGSKPGQPQQQQQQQQLQRLPSKLGSAAVSSNSSSSWDGSGVMQQVPDNFLPLNLGQIGSIGGMLGLPLSPGTAATTGLLEFEVSAVAAPAGESGQQQQRAAARAAASAALTVPVEPAAAAHGVQNVQPMGVNQAVAAGAANMGAPVPAAQTTEGAAGAVDSQQLLEHQQQQQQQQQQGPQQQCSRAELQANCVRSNSSSSCSVSSSDGSLQSRGSSAAAAAAGVPLPAAADLQGHSGPAGTQADCAVAGVQQCSGLLQQPCPQEQQQQQELGCSVSLVGSIPDVLCPVERPIDSTASGGKDLASPAADTASVQPRQQASTLAPGQGSPATKQHSSTCDFAAAQGHGVEPWAPASSSTASVQGAAAAMSGQTRKLRQVQSMPGAARQPQSMSDAASAAAAAAGALPGSGQSQQQQGDQKQRQQMQQDAAAAGAAIGDRQRQAAVARGVCSMCQGVNCCRCAHPPDSNSSSTCRNVGAFGACSGRMHAAPGVAAAAAAAAAVDIMEDVVLLPDAFGSSFQCAANEEPTQEQQGSPLRCVEAFQQLRQQHSIQPPLQQSEQQQHQQQREQCLPPRSTHADTPWECPMAESACDFSGDVRYMRDYSSLQQPGLQYWEAEVRPQASSIDAPWYQDQLQHQQPKQYSFSHHQQQQQQQGDWADWPYGGRQPDSQTELQRRLEQQLQSLDRQLQQLQQKAAAAGSADKDLQQNVKAQLRQWQRERQQQEQEAFETACAAAAVAGSSDARHHKQRERRHRQKHAQPVCSMPATCPCACADPWSPPAAAAAAAAAAGAAAAACVLTSGSPLASPPCSRCQLLPGRPWASYGTHNGSLSAAAAVGVGMTGDGSNSWRFGSPQKPCTGLRSGLLSSPVTPVLRRPSSAGAGLAPAPAVAAGAFWSPEKHSAAVVAAARSRAAASGCTHNQSASSSPSWGLAGYRVATMGSSSSSKWLLQAGLQECRQELLEQQALAAEADTLAAESAVVAAAIKCTARLL